MISNNSHIATDEEGSLSLLQITDTHLFANEQGDLLGVKTTQSLNAVVDHIIKKDHAFDAILSTGDIVQDQSEAAYRTFCQQIKRLNSPCYNLPGNHDEQQMMGKVLREEGFFQPNILESNYWTIIFLNTQVPGVPHGFLATEQFSFLEEALQQKQSLKNGKKVLVCMHHHALAVGSEWLDQHILKNSVDFIALISNYACVKGVLSGHVHQSLDRLLNGVRFLSTPSTSVQFKPLSKGFAVDTLTQGFRLITLKKSGIIETHVERIETDEFLADALSQGY